jgi:hypothetical protein
VALTSTVALIWDGTVAVTAGEESSGNCDVQLPASKSNSNPVTQAMKLRLVMFVFCPLIPDPCLVYLTAFFLR